MMTPGIGEMVKVHLPGESPWAEVVATNDDGTWLGRIDNRLFAERSDEERAAFAASEFGEGLPPLPRLHSYKENDVLRFGIDPEYSIWVPVPIKLSA